MNTRQRVCLFCFAFISIVELTFFPFFSLRLAVSSQVNELNIIRQSLYDLETQHEKIRRHYEEEVARARAESRAAAAAAVAQAAAASSSSGTSQAQSGQSSTISLYVFYVFIPSFLQALHLLQVS